MNKTVKVTIDWEAQNMQVVKANGESRLLPLYDREAFAEISRAWVDVGWVLKYSYAFTWLGRPIIQLPDDIVRIQEVVFQIKPDVIVETGIAHGGSLILYASLCKAMGKGRVIGVDVEIRPHNRAALQSHFLFPYITLIEGSSIDPAIVSQVRQALKPGETVAVMLDSCHTKSHVLSELEAYSPLVTPGSYIVAMDGVMEQLAGAPRTRPDWAWNNPRAAVREFLAGHPEFVLEEPPVPFDEGGVGNNRVTYWPDAYLRRK
jgi:cephalosporin hydroxylase